MFLILKRKIVLIFILFLALFLRLWDLEKVPISLFGDELDVGYQAFSILNTGRDYLGNFLPLHFQSLSEWRTPLYLYSAIPSVALFGLSPLGIRIPAAIFGFLSIFLIYLLVKEITGKDSDGLLASFLLAISPWHLQYSRAGFEVTEMLFLYILGLYLFFKGLIAPKYLMWSAFFLALSLWTYNTAKLMLPLTIMALLLIWGNKLKEIGKADVLKAVIIFILVSGPFLLSTFLGGGTRRIEGISIFNDPTAIPKIGFNRLNDAKMREENKIGNKLEDKIYHNLPGFFISTFLENYYRSFSTQFLFTKGDINLRHSIGTGQLYKFEAIFLVLGLFFMLTSKVEIRMKLFLLFWLLAAPIPAALTKEGGIHATRLIIMLPVLIILITFGIQGFLLLLSKRIRIFSISLLALLLFLNFAFYIHNYYLHYPWLSERWWHAGFKETVASAMEVNKDYDKVIISSADEPALIFFLAWSKYPPYDFQKEYNLYLNNQQQFNNRFRLGKYEFPPVGEGFSLYNLGNNLPKRTLYIATKKEIVLNLNLEPGRIPEDIKLVKTVNYPSGEPAFYFFTKQ